MKVAIAAIGTEITSGEVVNSNAAWLALQMEQLGFEVTHHLAVPDERDLMLQGFDYLDSKVDLIVTTGGLGPTTDDITAEVVALWLDKTFIFDEKIWMKLQKLYVERGLAIRDGHRTQCWFPEGAMIFNNPVGSACGFYSEANNKKILVLPGPPREIEGMWDDSIKSFLHGFPKADKKLLKKWTCLGITESELAEKIEELFKGSGVALGYRASVPYVQVKVWFNNESHFTDWEQKAKDLMRPWLVSEDGEDAIQNWVNKLPIGELQIYDSVSGGYLASRLWECDLEDNFSLICNSVFDQSQDAQGKTQFFVKINATGVEVEAGVWTDQYQKTERIVFPYKLPLNSKRAQKYITEMAFQVWAKILSS